MKSQSIVDCWSANLLRVNFRKWDIHYGNLLWIELIIIFYWIENSSVFILNYFSYSSVPILKNKHILNAIFLWFRRLIGFLSFTCTSFQYIFHLCWIWNHIQISRKGGISNFRVLWGEILKKIIILFHNEDTIV